MRFRAVFLWCIWLGLLQLSVGARVRHYKFDVEYMMRKPDCLEHVVMGISSQFPGPTIRAEVGDTLDTALTNTLHTEGTVIHWHGIRQLGTPWADGTAAISQCAINPGETYHYRFTVDRPGTYFYHGHYGMQRAAGKYSFATGVIIVASFSVLSFWLGWIVGPWPLFCALLISFLLGTAYSINDPLLRWKRFAVVAAMCILDVRAIIAQLAFFLYMQLNLSCLGKLQYPSLPTNCGGLPTELEGNAYEADKYSHGISNFVHCLRSKWVHSSKRVLIKDEQADFVTRNVLSVIINNSGYHHTILMVPLSLYYVGFCMLEGNCQEMLHFAEVQFYGDHKFSILGRDCVSHFLIQWNGEVVKEAIWEEEFNHKRQFLNLRLEDKSVFSAYFVP